MQEILIYEFLVMLLLKKSEKFRDSQNLIKIINWKFEYLEVRDLIQDLINKEYIQLLSPYYELTPLGQNVLEVQLKEGREILLNKFPKEKDFITMILNTDN
jgi:hypothetical protein